MSDPVTPDVTRTPDLQDAARPGDGTSQPVFRPLLDLIPGIPNGQVCGPDGCAPVE